MSRKIGIFSPFAQSKAHFEAELEIAQRYLDNEDEVYLFYCKRTNKGCEINPEFNQSVCDSCYGRFKSGSKLLEGRRLHIVPYLDLNDQNEATLSQLKTDFDNIDDLKSYYLDNYDIGYGVLSSLVSLLRSPKPDIKEHTKIIKNHIINSAKIYYSFINQIDKFNLEHVFFHNGRFSTFRAILRACEFKNIGFSTVDRGCDHNHYHVTENAMPHDLNYRIEEMNRMWREEKNDKKKTDIGTNYFLNRDHGNQEVLHKFTQDMQKGILPVNWDASKKNIGVFVSSEDEFVAIGSQFDNPLYNDQLDGLKHIIASLSEVNSDIHLYVRIHPNLKNVDSEQVLPYFDLENDFVTIIPSDSTIDTYALIKHVDKVVTFGSSVAIEAVFWETPSILIGNSSFDKEATFNPKSHEELLKLMSSNLKPKSREFAIKFGFYRSTLGTCFKYYSSESKFKGKFKGKYIEPSWDLKLKMRMRGYAKKLVSLS